MDIYIDEINFFMDRETKKVSHRKKVELVLEKSNMGDCIICSDIQNIAKNSKQLCETVAVMLEKKCKLIIGEEELDFTNVNNAETQGLIKMMNVFDQLEHEVLSNRVKMGVNNAKAKGKVIGRPSLRLENIPKTVIENYELLEQGELSKTDYAKRCNISRPTLNKYLEIMKTIR